MLALIVVFAHVLRNGLNGGIEQTGSEGEPGDVFKDIGMFNCLGRRSSPCERCMAGNKNSGNSDGVKLLGAKTADNDSPRIAYVARRDLLSSEGVCYRDRTMKVVGVRGSKAGNGLACLGPGCGELGMRVNNPANLWKLAVKQGVGVQIAGGAKIAFHDFAVKIGNDQVGRGEGSVIDSARLDHDQGFGSGAIDATGIAKGVWSETATRDFLVGAENLLA